ncbi:hypothetical protein [Nocardia neocaledoniensis]|uniref:hypothetical protein n=1 Tax=Nocardia neocaledoniensis TaxID=236511 RepID=UPI00245462B2|nr:hypothetical protein [Nocardia neocaledoniensis]
MSRRDRVIRNAVLADLLASARAARERAEVVCATPQGRWSGRRYIGPPPPICPPAPVRAAVPPALDEVQAHALDRAAHSAAHDGWSLWGGRWRNRAELAEIWSHETFLCWSNPFLPERFS